MKEAEKQRKGVRPVSYTHLEDGEKKKKDLVITKHTGLPFDCDLYDRSPWKCAEGIFF